MYKRMVEIIIKFNFEKSTLDRVMSFSTTG